MRICFLSSAHPPFDKRVYGKQAVSVAAKGYDVTHIAQSQDDNSIVKGVHIIGLRPKTGFMARARFLPRLFMAAKRSRYDIYHCNELDSWLVGIALKLFFGGKCIFDVHEHYPSDFVESRGISGWLGWLIYRMIQVYIRGLSVFTDAFVLAKQSLKGDFAFCNHKTIVVANYASIDSLDEKYLCKSREAAIRMVHVGLLSKVRGWPVMLDALSQLDNSKLTIVGEFNDGSYDEFLDRVKTLNLEDQVEVIGWLPYEDMMSVIANSNVGLVAFQPGVKNHVMALPHKLFDYMASGLAVIVPNFADEVVDVITRADCGIAVDSSSSYDLVTALNKLENPSIRSSFGDNGRASIKSMFNWEFELAKLLALYKRLEETRANV